MKALILDAQRVIYEGVISEAVLPAFGGELSIMDYHEPILVALTKGHIRLRPVVAKITRFRRRGREASEHVKPIAVRAGLARMKGNELVVLVE